MSCRRVALWVLLVPFVAQADTPPADVNAQLTAMQTQIDILNKRLEQLEQMLRLRLPPLDAPVSTTGTGTVPTPHPSITTTPGTSTPLTPVPATPAHGRPELAAYQELEVLRANWKQLQRGLSGTEVRRLLGKPHSELVLDRQTLWYYRYPGIGGGSVMLDSSNEVSGWQEPPFNRW